MKIKTILYIVAGALLVLLALHLAFNTDWVALFKSLHHPPQH